jgi:[acyl-carrier-protein] S-malonyltransferase
MMPGYAMIFPGQGSQYVGMGRDLYTTSPAAKAVFAAADEAWRGSLTHIIFEGPAESLTDTSNAQPALYVMSLACRAALQEAMGTKTSCQPAYVAGHSLGEYSALGMAGVFSFAEGLKLVRARGQAMRAAGDVQPGGMAAILGLDTPVVAGLCRETSVQTGQPVVIANDNAPGQVVISGAREAVAAVGERAKALGAKRVLPLAVSVAAHSPLMGSVMQGFGPVLRSAQIDVPRISVIGNVQAQPLTTASQVVAELDAQLTSPVRWVDSVQYMVAHGIHTFIEMGPKEVLAGLVKRIVPDATCVSCGSVPGVEQAAQFLQTLAAET